MEYQNDEVVYYSSANASFFGRLAYGAQAKVLGGLNCSVEMRHKFLDYDKKLPTGYELKRKLWYNEIILGASYQFGDVALLGVTYAKYLKYDYTNWSQYSSITPTSINEKPSSLIVSGEVSYSNFVLKGMYQYSNAKYSITDLTRVTELQDYTNFVSFAVVYNFSYKDISRLFD